MIKKIMYVDYMNRTRVTWSTKFSHPFSNHI